MPTSGLRFRAGPATICLDRWGRVVSVQHDDRPGVRYLRGMSIEGVQLAGRSWTLTAPEVLVDEDEVEFGYSVGDQLRLVVRHSFSAGWGVRIALTAGSSGPPVQVDALHWSLAPADQNVGWVLAAGAEASYSVHPVDGSGPVLGGALRLGSVAGGGPDGLVIGPVQLDPGGRYVVQWWWDWYSHPAAFGRDRHPDVPLATDHFVGEAATMALDHDVAVIAPGPVEVLEADDHRDLVADQSGCWTVDLHSARGRTSLDLAWVEPVPDTLGVAAAIALSRPRTAANVIKLAGVHEAMVVQDALLGASSQAGTIDDVDEAVEALDLFTARLVGDDASGPFEAAYLCGEYARTGDADLLGEAITVLLGQRSVTAGLGLAVAQLGVAAVLSGRRVDRVLDHARSLLDRAVSDPDPSPDPAPGGASVNTQIAQLELAAVLHRRADASWHTPGRVSLDVRVAALGPHLGAGLKGRPVRPLAVDTLSHLIATMQLVPEAVSARLQAEWDCSAHALARRSIPALLGRLGDDRDATVRAAHTWLIAGRTSY